VVESFVRCRRLPSLVVNASGDERDDEVDEDAGGDVNDAGGDAAGVTSVRSSPIVDEVAGNSIDVICGCAADGS